MEQPREAGLGGRVESTLEAAFTCSSVSVLLWPSETSTTSEPLPAGAVRRIVRSSTLAATDARPMTRACNP